MRTLLFIALALLAFAYVANASYANQDPLRLFSEFKERYSKAYPSPAEHNTRLLVFQQNMQHVDELNRLHNTDAFTVETPFADLSPQEFKDTYLMKEDEVQGFIQAFNALPQWNDAHLNYANNTVGAVSNFDWRNSGIVTPVKDQQQCGSCWAFAATEVLESMWARYGNALPVLSPQQLVDCTYTGGRSGCNGGWPSDGWNYLKTVGGQTYESNYPYKATYQGCLYRGGQGVAKVSQSISVSSGNENALYNYVTSTSPVAVAVDATNFQYYKAGTIFPASSCTTKINHAVVATGYQNINGQDVWNIRNSWNTWWGNQGYLYLPMWQNACTVSTYGLGVK